MAEDYATLEEWIASRPESVQKLAAKFPINSTLILLDGQKYYLLGYTEDEKLIMSKVDPHKDYDGARATQEYICAKHLKREPSNG